MKSKILKQEKNLLLDREEIRIEITSKSTPTKEQAKEAIGKDPKLTIIKRINNNFGKQQFVVDAVVYNSTEDKDKIETVPQKTRKKIEADRIAAEVATKKAAEQEEKAKAGEQTKAAAENEKKPEEKTE